MNSIEVGLIALAVGLVEIIKQLLTKMFGRRSSDGFTSEDRERLRHLLEMHEVRDDDGVPMWYISRSREQEQLKLLSRMTDTLHRMSLVQRDVLKSLESHERALERLLDKIDRMR